MLLIGVILEPKWIFTNIDATKIDLGFELWKCKKLLRDYFPSADCTLPETPFLYLNWSTQKPQIEALK